MKEVCKLDSAICSQKYRIRLLECIANEKVLLKGLPRISCDIYEHYLWMVDRQASVESNHLNVVIETTFVQKNKVPTLRKTSKNPFSCIASTMWSIQGQRVDQEAIKCARLLQIDQFLNRTRHLSFSGCYALTNTDFNSLNSLNRLQSLDLTDCVQITGSALQHVLTVCPALQSINLSGCIKLCDEDVRCLAAHCHQLSSVNIGRCPSLSRASTRWIAVHCGERLREYLSDNVLELDITLLQKCHCLEVLSIPNSILSRCVQSFIATNWQCVLLTSLDLSGCADLSSETLIAVTKRAAKLTSLNTALCDMLTDTGLFMLPINHC